MFVCSKTVAAAVNTSTSSVNDCRLRLRKSADDVIVSRDHARDVLDRMATHFSAQQVHRNYFLYEAFCHSYIFQNFETNFFTVPNCISRWRNYEAFVAYDQLLVQFVARHRRRQCPCTSRLVGCLEGPQSRTYTGTAYIVHPFAPPRKIIHTSNVSAVAAIS